MREYQNQKKFQQAVGYLAEPVSTILSYLPDFDKSVIHEVRMRVGQPLSVTIGQEIFFLTQQSKREPNPSGSCYIVTRADLQNCMRTLCQYSVHSHMEEIREGFLSVRGGHRAGICGTAVCQGNELLNIREISSINLRICRQIDGCADPLMPHLLEGDRPVGMLIAGPPGSGKTTLLRDIARQLSLGTGRKRYKTAIVDERSEIASVFEGEPQNDVGICTDVLNGYPKDVGMLHAIRALSPQIILCDEIGSAREVEAVMGCVNAGVAVLTTIHASNIEELTRRPQAVSLLESGAFQKLVLLKDSSHPCTIHQVVEVSELYDQVHWPRVNRTVLCAERVSGSLFPEKAGTKVESGGFLYSCAEQ